MKWHDFSMQGSSTWRLLVSFFLLSLVIRVGFLTPVVTSKVKSAFDETGYFSRAVGASNALRDILSGHLPSHEHLMSLYGGSGRPGGKWPPLHSMLLGAVLLPLGPEEAVARAVVVLLSSITTPLVYVLSLKLSNRTAATTAALVHVFYPSFIAYSHYLWTETTYILLLLLSIYFAILLVDAQTHRQALFYAVLCGCFLGLCGLTRAAVLPYLFAIPVWLVFRMKGTRSKIIIPIVVVISWLIVLLPWEATLALNTKSIVPISTGGSYNLYLGNNPWVPQGLGSSWGDKESKDLAEDAIKSYKATYSVDDETAARALAMEEIKNNFGAFLLRCVYRLRMLWSGDMFALRHVLRAVYPPMSSGFVALISVVVLVSYLLLASFACYGLAGTSSRLRNNDLILILLFTGMVAPVVTISMSRLHIPFLAVLLPAVGHGVANLKRRPSLARGLVTVFAIVLLVVAVLSSAPLVVTYHLVPSSYYARPVNWLDDFLGSDALFRDSVSFRWTDADASDHITITILSEDYVFTTSQTKEYSWEASRESGVLNLHVSSPTARSPLAIKLSSQTLSQTVVVQPVEASYWQQWRTSSLDGLEYRWDGGRGRAEGRLEE